MSKDLKIVDVEKYLNQSKTFLLIMFLVKQ